jgi:hypothetical protein
MCIRRVAVAEQWVACFQEQYWKGLAYSDHIQVGTVDCTDSAVAAECPMAGAVDLVVELETP